MNPANASILARTDYSLLDPWIRLFYAMRWLYTILGSIRGPLKKTLRYIRTRLPPVNFITLHYSYFIATCLLGGLILWASATPPRSLEFTDALFLAVSAMTLAGLNTVNLSRLNTFQQVVLFVLILMGSAVFVSSFVLYVRKRAFEKKFNDFFLRRLESRGRNRSRSLRPTWSRSRKSTALTSNEKQDLEELGGDKHDHSTADGNDQSTSLPGRHHTPPARGSQGTGMLSSPDRDMASEKASESPPPPLSRSGLHFREDTQFNRQHNARSPTSPRRRRHSIFNAQGVGARSTASLEPTSTAPRSVNLRTTGETSLDPLANREDAPRQFEDKAGWISRNSQFHGLDDNERRRLGGYEYRAVKFLTWLVPAYFFLFNALGCLACGAWIASYRSASAQENGLNPWWVGIFNGVSAFGNNGMSLLDANMTEYQTGYYLLLTMGLLILAGNTAYPIFLRLIIWCLHKAAGYLEGRSSPDSSARWAEHAATLRFLLNHPRRCYTNLFPARHTWWLLFAVVTLNGVDWAAFEILNIGNEKLGKLSPGVRAIDGLFQALAVRSGGFYVVNISNVRISLQVLYAVMMYISVYPVVITMRNSNVYEERSLGIYAEDEPSIDQQQTKDGQGSGFFRRLTDHVIGNTGGKESNSTFIGQQLRAQLAHDAWIIVLGLFLIMIIETGQFSRDPINFSVFNFLFEIVSAYGCVGLTVGIPWEAYSFCGTWHKLSKLILCVIMLRGRHRGLPVAIDRAVLLPGEANELAEEDDGRIRLARTMSRGRETV